MRFILPFILVIAVTALAACDRSSSPQEQAPGGAPDAPSDVPSDMPADTVGNEMLESASGMTAELVRDYAGAPAPDAAFTGADGRQVRLSDYRGRPLLVNVWATWCAPCKAEMPTIDALAELEAGRLSVIAVSQDLQGRRPVREFFGDIGIRNLEPFTDSANALSAAFDHRLKLPTTILYDAQGNEVWRVEGGVEWDDEVIAGLLDEAF